MYWSPNSGGWNKIHGTVEEVPRLDSFDIENDWGTLFTYQERAKPSFSITTILLSTENRIGRFWRYGTE